MKNLIFFPGSIWVLLLIFSAAQGEYPQYPRYHQSTNNKPGVFRNYRGETVDKLSHSRYNGDRGIFRNYQGQQTSSYRTANNRATIDANIIDRYGNKYLVKDRTGRQLSSYTTNHDRTVFRDQTGKPLGYAYRAHNKIIYRDAKGKLVGTFDDISR